MKFQDEDEAKARLDRAVAQMQKLTRQLLAQDGASWNPDVLLALTESYVVAMDEYKAAEINMLEAEGATFTAHNMRLEHIARKLHSLRRFTDEEEEWDSNLSDDDMDAIDGYLRQWQDEEGADKR